MLFRSKQTSDKAIPANYWPYLTLPLAGYQYFPVDAVLTRYPPVGEWSEIQSTHIEYGNQNVYSIPDDASRTPDGIRARLDLVDRLMQGSPDPAAQRVLQRARDMLQGRLGASAGPGGTPAGGK